MEIYLEFAKWLDGIFENNHMPKAVKAYCFNIYEEEDENGAASGEYGVQLIASDEFDENDGGDWACSEIWSSEENIFYIDHSDEKECRLQPWTAVRGRSCQRLPRIRKM